VHKFRHCDLSVDVPESDHSLNQAFVESLPSDLKSLSGGLHEAMKSMTRSLFNEKDRDVLNASLTSKSGIVFGSSCSASQRQSAFGTLQGLEFTGFSQRDVRLEDILGIADAEEDKEFDEQSSIWQAPEHDQSASELIAALEGSKVTSQGDLSHSGAELKPFDCSGLSDIPHSFDSEKTNPPDAQQGIDSEQVTNRRGIPLLPLNLLEKPAELQVFCFDESSGRPPQYRSPRREPELKLNISVSINESSITLISECSSLYIEERSRDKIKLKSRGKEDSLLPILNLSIENKSSSRIIQPRIAPTAMLPRVLPIKPPSAPRHGLKNFRGRSLMPAKRLSPLSIPTSPSYRPSLSRGACNEGSVQDKSTSPKLFNRFRMRRFCEQR
jgi:hypothetical protein